MNKIVNDFFDKYIKANEIEKLRLIETLPMIAEKKDNIERHILSSLLNSYLMDMQDYYEDRIVIENIRKQGALQELKELKKWKVDNFDFSLEHRIDKRIKELEKEGVLKE